MSLHRLIVRALASALAFALVLDPAMASGLANDPEASCPRVSSLFKSEALAAFPAPAFAPAGRKVSARVRREIKAVRPGVWIPILIYGLIVLLHHHASGPLWGAALLGPNYLQQVRDEIARLCEQGPTTTPIDPDVFSATELRMKSIQDTDELVQAWKILFRESTEKTLEGFTLWLQSYFRAMYDQGWGYQEFIDEHLSLLSRWLGNEGEDLRGLVDLIAGAANDVRRHLTLSHYDEISSRSERGQPLRIVYVTPEARPYSEKGGLAGVAGPLPQAMNRLNAWSTTITLAYDDVIMRRESPMGAPLIRRPFILKNRPVQFDITINGEVHPCAVELAGTNSAYEANPPFFFLRDVHPNATKRLTHLPYGAHADSKTAEELQIKQTVFLSEGAILLTKLLVKEKWMSAAPDVMIAHDWPASLVGPYLKTKYADDPDLKGVKSGFFMHNNISAYQGNFNRKYFHFLGLAWDHLHSFAYEEACDDHGIRLSGWREQLSLVRAALFQADIVLTTSQTFALMAQSKEFGYGLESLLQIKARLGRLIGIPHGFSYHLAHAQVHSEAEAQKVLAIKRQAKKALLEETGLWEAIEKAWRYRLRESATFEADLQRELAKELDKPVEVMIARLDVYQKGFDLLLPEFQKRSNSNALRKMLAEGNSHVIILGDPTGGSSEFVTYVSNLSSMYPDRLAFYPRFREPIKDKTSRLLSGMFPGREIRSMADLMMAGGDIFWMLSRIEPFGISVQEAHERGMLVLGTTNGGPAEQIIDYRADPVHGNGLLFGQLFSDVDTALQGIGKPAIFEPLSRVSAYQKEFTPDAFAETRRQLLDLYQHHRDVFDRLRINAWNRRDTWDQPAGDHLMALARVFGRHDLVENPEKFDPTRRPALIPGIPTSVEPEAHAPRECDLIVSIGGSHVTLELKKDGKRLESMTIDGKAYELALKSRETYERMLLDALTQFLNHHAPLQLRNVSIGSPGLIRDGVVLFAENVPLTGVPLAQLVQRHLQSLGQPSDLRVQLENDMLHEAGHAVPPRSLILNLGTGVNMVAIDGDLRESLEFGTLRSEDGTTIENAYKTAKKSNDAEKIIDSFIEPLVGLVRQSRARYLTLTGGGSEWDGVFDALKRRLAQNGATDVVLLKMGEDDPHVHKEAAGPSELLLRGGLKTLGHLYGSILIQGKKSHAKPFYVATFSASGWLAVLSGQLDILESQIAERETGSALHEWLAGLLRWRIEQSLATLNYYLSRIYGALRVHYPSAAQAWEGWTEPVRILRARVNALESVFLETSLPLRAAA